MANNTILIIDYEPRSIERFRDPLVAAGFSVEIATDGISGIEAFHRLNPNMVLVEAMIPKKHGFEVCQELKRTPHGRGTPVIITTGVYKGRKYRTQALHIYGCDEYIEKPIAAAQLLEIVGRFLTLDAAAPSGAKPELTPAAPETGREPIVRTNIDAVAKPGPSAARADDGDDEITARLDALLSGVGGESPLFAAPERLAVAAATETDPFAQMRAELDRELNSIPTPMAFELAPRLEPIPEPPAPDEYAMPSVLDEIPSPPVASPLALAPALAPTPASAAEADEQAGQLVSFESKRRRKGKKHEKQNAKQSPEEEQLAEVAEVAEVAEIAPVQPAPPSPVVSPIPPAAIATKPDAGHRVVEVTLPKGTITESELMTPTGKRGMPAWGWGAVAAVVVVGLYFAYPRGGSERVPSTPAAESTAPTVADERPRASEAPEAGAPAAATPPAPQPPQASAENPRPTVAAAKLPAPKKRPDAALSQAAAPASNQPARPTQAKAEPPKPQPVTNVPSAPTSPEASGTGVESVASPVPDPAPAPAEVERGALVPIDIADTMPVPVSRRAPNYSSAARQMRLSGTVTMNVLVNDRGTVDRVVLVNGVPGADLNDAAIAAAKSWTYTPAKKDGVPVKVWRSEQVVFRP